MLSREEVKETIQQVALSIAAALDTEIMVMDDKRNIVGGTVTHQSMYHVGNGYDYIMKNRKVIVIENPGFDELCKGCKYYHCCNELIELAAPIIVQEECVGVISVTTFKEDNRQNILSKQKDYCTFLMNMSGLISSKVEEVTAKDELDVTALRMSAIINSVNEGMIALDENGIIIHCNPLAETILRTPMSTLIGTNWATWFFNDADVKIQALSKHEISLKNGDGKEIDAYISMNPIVAHDKEPLGTIIVIEEAVKVNNFVTNIMGYNRKTFYFSHIIGKGKAITETKNKAMKASHTNSTLLIRGESGTGKELFARAIHNNSNRANGPFVALNCGAIPDTLLESELFGYEGGAFTGASKRGKPGKFELADKGTIFLDEIGDMPIYLQVKLLRVLQERSIQRIGDVKEKEIDIRVISATNKDLEKLVSENRFREDLFYRLNVIPLFVPPLRERRDDMLDLITYFLKKYNTLLGKNVVNIEESAQAFLLMSSWPGNVRELENVMEYALNMENTDTITMESLPEYIKSSTAQENDKVQSLKEKLRRYETGLIWEMLQHYGKSAEAKIIISNELGIGIATLYRKLRELHLD